MAIATAAENLKVFNGRSTGNFCHPAKVEWFSIQILVNYAIFKLLSNFSIHVTVLKFSFVHGQTIFVSPVIRKGKSQQKFRGS